MPPLVTPVNTQSDDVTRESGKEITAATDMSAPEKDALHDLLERWVAMRPSNGTTALSITTIFVVHGMATSPPSTKKYVDLDEGLMMKAAIRRAILNYDQCEAARIEQYNKALIIALARLRILAFAKAGTQEVPSVNDAHRVNGRIKVVELASDQLLEISTDLGDIARDCVRLRVDSLSYGAAATPYLWASEAGDLKKTNVAYRQQDSRISTMAPAGDSLAEPIAAAELRAEAIDEKRASIQVEKRASLTADPRAGHVPAVTPDGELPNAQELATLRRVSNTIPVKLLSIAFY
ncbi:hypothetical protein CEP52_011342 [Fusarium oligoseptatum]|uniref:Uncharacterized protein n=1 Tax=Fusarium oligoseptatum TaxID=2604345 RepID=A0A428T3S1_9HYPO|nr:hypothetical protein CEP52_011342 [Fusarium oligoseptatum]